MSEEATRARVAYRRLRRAAGVADLAAVEARTGELEVALAEEVALQRPLSDLVAGLERDVAGLLGARRSP